MEEQDEIYAFAEQVLQNDDLFLVDIELKGSAGNRVIWVYVESEGGNISLDRCAEINRELGLLMDAGGWHGRKYTLNVSSPGVDRPLKDFRQYVNNLGRNASVVYKKQDEEIKVEGKLIDANQEAVTLETEQETQQVVPFSDILETRIMVSFK